MIDLQLDWTDFKSKFTTSNNIFYIKFDDNLYILWVIYEFANFSCTLNNSTDITNFETSYKANSIDITTLPVFLNKFNQLKTYDQQVRGPLTYLFAYFTTANIGVSTDAGDFNSWYNIKYLDSNGDETQVQNDCVKTQLDFEALENIELGGGWLNVFTIPSPIIQHTKMIAAPDIPPESGGSFIMASNIRLTKIEKIDIFARKVKYVAYDPVYHSGKVRFDIPHAAGQQISGELLLEVYRGLTGET